MDHDLTVHDVQVRERGVDELVAVDAVAGGDRRHPGEQHAQRIRNCESNQRPHPDAVSV
jgi:hypothetical protein